MRGAFPQEVLLRDASFMFVVLCTLSSPSSLFLAGSQNSLSDTCTTGCKTPVTQRNTFPQLTLRDTLITNSTELGGRFSAGYKLKEGGLSR
ncbi:hypothetical protein EPR50_G00109420 [Perca flavescens]|uniref:Uncharacterized protein n=1 Tax=Perca flavescens TaxID=8167 RepID=A0A484CXU9_PERFV|nr:hypothetical protein EPR50_G00109420 [Perca flavescens]